MEMGKLRYRRPDQFLVIQKHQGGLWSLLKSLWTGELGKQFIEARRVPSDTEYGLERNTDSRFVILVSNLLIWLISVLYWPMIWVGRVVEFFLNLLSHNDGLLGLIWNTLTWKLVIPQRDTETFLSTIGHLDPRLKLYMHEVSITAEDIKKAIGNPLYSKALMDLCMMSSKLAYENPKVVEHVVTDFWKMDFVEFYNGWNDYQQKKSTHAFILCDKDEDVNLILISFRGTGVFDPDGWSTDVDYSWYDIPNVGKVHIGFLEAMGLGNREDLSTFNQNLPDEDGNTPQTTSVKPDSSGARPHESGNKNDISGGTDVLTAYYAIKGKLKYLLDTHPNAKFAVTGHSLGGALALLFPTVLLINKEEELMKRLLGVYTFGQPRVGDEKLRNYMYPHLCEPVPKYFRVVYCNDIVPRVPYDDDTFSYKHFGTCIYYNSFFVQQNLGEEPNPNYFGWTFLPVVHVNAVWEFMRSLYMGFIYGKEFNESWCSVLFRLVGLAFPGLAAHGPTNYVNCPRLGQAIGGD